MSKIWLALIALVLLAGVPAVAAGWTDSFKTCDGHGSGKVNRSEWTSCASKASDPTISPALTMLGQDEWTGGELQKTDLGNNCMKLECSWCPCQNNLDDPERQKSSHPT